MFFPLTVRDFLDRAVTVYPERVGVVDEPEQPAPSWGEVTYAELGRRARSQAAYLDDLGVPQGARVAIVSQNSARLLASFFGVSGWGRILVPVNFRLAPAEVAYIVEHSGAEVLMVDPEVRGLLDSVTAEHTFVLGEDDEAMWATRGEPEPWTGDESATATINYTSGTTARPKTIPITREALLGEMSPPLRSALDLVQQRVQDLAQLGPSFVSVTYGAGGSTRQLTVDVGPRDAGRVPASSSVSTSWLVASTSDAGAGVRVSSSVAPSRPRMLIFSSAPVMASKPVAKTMVSTSWWPWAVCTPVGVMRVMPPSEMSTRVTLSRLNVS